MYAGAATGKQTKKLAEATFASAAKLLGEKELVSRIGAIGQFSMTCLTTIAYDCTPTPEMPNRLQK